MWKFIGGNIRPDVSKTTLQSTENVETRRHLLHRKGGDRRKSLKK